MEATSVFSVEIQEKVLYGHILHCHNLQKGLFPISRQGNGKVKVSNKMYS